MSKFGTNPDPTPYGEKPGSKKGCCSLFTKLTITMELSNVKTQPWYKGKKYCAQVAVTGTIEATKECIDYGAALEKAGKIGVFPLSCNASVSNLFYSIDQEKIKIHDFKLKECGPCDPSESGECDCTSGEQEAFPPFTSEICNNSCDSGWGKAMKKDMAAPLKAALQGVKGGGCSCNGCDFCVKISPLPTDGNGNLNIPSFGEFFKLMIISAGRGVTRSSTWREALGISDWYGILPFVLSVGQGQSIVDMFDTQPDFCKNLEQKP